MLVSCLSPSWTPGLWLCPPPCSMLPNMGPMWACSAAWTRPSVAAWLCSSLRRPCYNIYCRGWSHGFLRTPAWKDPACDCFICLMRTNFFCRFKVFEKLRPDRFFERFEWEPPIHTVGVHMHEFEIPPIDEAVEIVVIKLQYSQLGQLIHDDAHLERLVDRHFLLSKLWLKPIADLLHVIEPSHADRFALSITRLSFVYITVVFLLL